MSFNKLSYDSCAYNLTVAESMSSLYYNLYTGKYENCEDCKNGNYTTILSHEVRADVENELFGLRRPNTRCPQNKFDPNNNYEPPKHTPPQLCQSIYYITPNNLIRHHVEKFTNTMDIQDQYGNNIDILLMEKPEQDLANKYIEPNDVVLELGARYGSVSCVINMKLNNKKNQVVVEPDERVWSALERNKIANNCDFNIVKGFISNKNLDLTNLDDHYNGYGATYIENKETKIKSFTLDNIQKLYNLKFNVLVADCEGFLEIFFDENPTFYDNLRLIIFEADYPEKCNYNKIRNTLKLKGFNELLHGHQNVWIKL